MSDKEPMVIEFTVNDGKEDVTLVYDYSKLRLSQMKLAEAVYQYQADLEKRPPRSWDEKLTLGAADYDLHVLSYILLKKMPDGSLQGFKGGETQKPILKLVENITSHDAKKAEEVIEDFFDRREKYSLALLVRSKYERQYGEQFNSQMLEALRAVMSQAGQLPESSEIVNADKTESGIKENEADD